MIEMTDVSFAYPGTERKVLDGLRLNIDDGEFLCIIGHSGCGKSTLLRLLAGLDAPQEGTILTDGKPVTGPSSDRTMVFQQYSLFPWMNVKKNVVFAVRKTGKFTAAEAGERADIFLKKVGLEADAGKYPYQLSGGMRQRAAIARALAMDSPYMLLDEPFGALDTKIRKELQELLQELWYSSGTSDEPKTVIFVTHDLEEAMILGSRIVFLQNGVISREKRIDRSINCCCIEKQGKEECLKMKEELAGWYR
ncbi:MAG: ABC transporter ATP-binding protein [Anaerovoracaceae bacterium]